MRRTASIFLLLAAAVALQAPFAIASFAGDESDPQQPGEPEKQEGEDRWVPSLAITGGATIQQHQGFAESLRFLESDPTTALPLRPLESPNPVDGDDLGVFPFVGASAQLMTPALPIPTRPRLFVSGEILPTFASDHAVAVEGDPSCFTGPEPGAPCARDDDVRLHRFPQSSANGLGSTTTARLGDLVFGASLGVAWPFRIGKRQLRVKPSVGWIRYEVEAEGLVVDGVCIPDADCAPWVAHPDGRFREYNLTAKASQKFDGIGAGLDLEMDAGRFGPIGTSLFLGGGAYHILGNRDFSFSASETFPEEPVPLGVFPAETAVANFGVEVDPWIYRTHVGIRFQWLGLRK